MYLFKEAGLKLLALVFVLSFLIILAISPRESLSYLISLIPPAVLILVLYLNFIFNATPQEIYTEQLEMVRDLENELSSERVVSRLVLSTEMSKDGKFARIKVHNSNNGDVVCYGLLKSAMLRRQNGHENIARDIDEHESYLSWSKGSQTGEKTIRRESAKRIDVARKEAGGMRFLFKSWETPELHVGQVEYTAIIRGRIIDDSELADKLFRVLVSSDGLELDIEEITNEEER